MARGALRALETEMFTYKDKAGESAFTFFPIKVQNMAAFS